MALRATDGHPDDYARRVIAGAIPAGKFHVLSCERHLQDRERERVDSAYPFRFDLEYARRFFRFAEKLKHYKGRQWAGRFIELSECQVFRLGCIFGWRVKATGLRRFTTAYNELPRKQGKSLEAAVVALYVTFFEGEQGAEGYCIATKEAQARIVFNDCKKLVKSSGLKSRIRVQARNLHREDTASKLEPLGSDSESTDGLNPCLLIIDEFHAQKNRGLIDVVESATGSRLNPLNYQITTAGDDPVSPGGDQHDYATRILEGVIVDAATEAFFAFIAHADLDDDPWAETTWKKANPHYGGSVNPEDILKLALKAKQMPSAAAEFKQKRLNLWVNATAPCLSLDGWRKGQSHGDRVAFAKALEHEPCWIGVDLAAKLDLMALSAVFPPRPGRGSWHVLQYLWTPDETMAVRAHRDRAPYDVWVSKGWLRTTPGPILDHAVIRETLKDLRSLYDIESIWFDPWHADQIIHQLVTEDGFSEQQVLVIPQTYAGRGTGDAKLKAEILAGAVDACNCPVTGWAVSNATEDVDRNDNIFFTKNPRKSRGRIDPVTAMSNALAGWLRQRPAEEPEYKMLILGGSR